MRVMAMLFLLGCASMRIPYSFDTPMVPKSGDDTIILYGSSLESLRSSLLRSGYTFESDGYEYLVTYPRQSPSYNFNYILKVIEVEDSIYIRPEMEQLTLGRQMSWFRWKYRDLKGDTNADAFGYFFPHVLTNTKEIYFKREVN